MLNIKFQNYDETRIRFSIPEDTHVRLKLINQMGTEIQTLIDAEAPAGDHTVSLNANTLAPGIYYYQIKAGNFTATKKFVLIR